jgi:hypothetical protein
MPDYKNGQIYRLWSPHTDKFYIGSTCTMLAKRLYEHKSHYKSFLKGNQYKTAAELFKLGIDDVKIELMELYPCSSKTELCRREGILQRQHKDTIVNFIVAGRTPNDYYLEHKDVLCQKSKERRDNDPDYNKKGKERRDNDPDYNKKCRERRANDPDYNKKRRERSAAKKALLASQEGLISAT